MSGTKILLMNPLEKQTSKECIVMELKNLKKCKRLNVEELLTALNGGFGFTEACIEMGHYSGTLFWFPLRKTTSKLSDNIYDQSKVLDLFRSFQTEAVDSLLFLKSVCQIKLFCKCSGTDMDFPGDEPFFLAQLQDSNDTVKKARKSFLGKIKKLKGGLPSSDITSVTHVKFKTVCKNTLQSVTSESDWVVVNMYKCKDLSVKLSKLIKDETAGFIPYAGVAKQLNSNERSFKGHIFCFLPLPQEKKSLTGLPVHVNGFFAVSKNRRHLKWASADQDTLATHRDKAIEWNECLVGEVIPAVYAQLLQEMIDLSKRCGNPKERVNDVYNCIPTYSLVDTKWEAVAESLSKRINEIDYVFLPNCCMWVNSLNPTYTMFDKQPVDEQTKECVRKTLDKYANVNTAAVPQHVWEFLNKSDVSPKDITAAELSRILRTEKVYTEATDAEKLTLLNYIMIENDNQLLNGLQLLPLENENFTTFSRREESSTVLYVCTAKEIELFPGLEHMFVSTRLPPDTTNILEAIAQQGKAYKSQRSR